VYIYQVLHDEKGSFSAQLKREREREREREWKQTE
jgi:hypothetical protein